VESHGDERKDCWDWRERDVFLNGGIDAYNRQNLVKEAKTCICHVYICILFVSYTYYIWDF
jgi:hypothetical protein